MLVFPEKFVIQGPAANAVFLDEIESTVDLAVQENPGPRQATMTVLGSQVPLAPQYPRPLERKRNFAHLWAAPLHPFACKNIPNAASSDQYMSAAKNHGVWPRSRDCAEMRPLPSLRRILAVGPFAYKGTRPLRRFCHRPERRRGFAGKEIRPSR